MLRLERVSKTYRTTDVETAALDDLSLEVQAGEFLAVMGPSGCGKSTLLNILGLIDSPSSGAYWFNGEDVAQCSERELSVRRRAHVGFVFQNFNLIDDLNVADNVEVALLYLGLRSAERRQRVAIARALVAHPKLILADEPTGNLDTANGDAVMEMLAGILNGGTTIVMVTHSQEYANRAHRVVHMLDGRLYSQGRNSLRATSDPVED
jgi:putative ABC transport system ATP-binding protein